MTLIGFTLIQQKMKPTKIENIKDLLSFIDEYYDTEHQNTVISAVKNYFDVIVVFFGEESKESFRTKVESFYNYCLTSNDKPSFLLRNPEDEFEIGQLLEKYY